MKIENRNKLITLILISLITCSTVIGRCMRFNLWNNEKAYIVGTVILSFAIFLFEIHDKIAWTNKNSVIFGIVMLASFMLATVLSFTGINEFVPLFVPVIAVAVLYGADSGICYGLFYTSYIFLALYHSTEISKDAVVLRWITIAIILSLAVKYMTNMTQIIFSGLTVLFSTTIVNILYFNLPYDKVKYDLIFRNMAAIILTLIAGFIIFFAKKLFLRDKKNSSKLGRICGELYPPIAEYKKKATTSYYHAIDVGDLANLAAQKVGADSMIVQAGALYHEIGKSVSKDYIKSGVAICKQNDIPDCISDIIIEHCLKIRNPQTIESALIMLADSIINSFNYVEANNQVISNDKVIENVMKVRLDSGALSECNMTLKQYNEIRKVFLSAYPE